MPAATLLLDIYDADAAGIVTAARLQRTPLVERLAQLDAERAEVQAKIDAVDLEARQALDAARGVLLDALYVKLDPEGSPVPRPGAPTGPRKRKEPEPPKEPTTPAAPQEPASAGQGDGFALFAEAVADRAPQPDLDALGWTADGPGADLTDAQTRVVAKHRISFDDLDTWKDDAPVAFGKAWTMSEPARVTT